MAKETKEPAKALVAPADQSSQEQLESLCHELRARSRKLQMEGDEKNEIIGVLRDELETLKEQNDKFQREAIQLLKDSKRAKELQDENDYLQDKLGDLEKLETEIRRLKERLSELDFLKIRNRELEDDLSRAQQEHERLEQADAQAAIKLARLAELETELDKWKEFAHESQAEKAQAQAKLLEAIEQEAKLRACHEKVEDEVKRLRLLVKSLEEQRDEEQASTSLVLTDELKHDSLAATLVIDDQPTGNSSSAPTSIKFELSRQLEQELSQQNSTLKSQLELKQTELERVQAKNRDILGELESNRKLISDLRQDLNSEKSIASKLNSQLAIFTKQIKHLDKQYFPIHDQHSASSTTTTTTASTLTASIKSSVSSQSNFNLKSNDKKLVEPVKSVQPSTGDKLKSDKNNELSIATTTTTTNSNKVTATQYQKDNLDLESKAKHGSIESELRPTKLPEQQLAHLTSLQHQYYYHHLQHMHHLHHLHLQHHRLHHKHQHQMSSPSNGLQQDQQAASKSLPTTNGKTNYQASPQRKPAEPLYSSGSQFYAPALDLDKVQIDVTANNSINQSNELQIQRAKLVSNQNHNAKLKQSQPLVMREDLDNLRSSPNGQTSMPSPERSHYQLSHHKVSRLREINGLPTIPDVAYAQNSNGDQQTSQDALTEVASGKTSRHDNSSLLINGCSPTSSSSSSPTSSDSSNLIQSSAASSSSSSLNSMSAPSSSLNRSALRHTTDRNRRQYSAERDLTSAAPMMMNLSRVGSCRVGKTNQGNQLMYESALMRTPVASQQPPMRTSKILNISQQASNGVYTTCQHQHRGQSRTEGFEGANPQNRVNQDVGRNETLANNLANIRLNDRLAFTSLRLPRKSAERTFVGDQWMAGNHDARNGLRTTKIGSLSPEKQPPALAKNVISNGKAQSNKATKPSANSINNNNNNNSSTGATNGNGINKSSVWFEYGCV